MNLEKLTESSTGLNTSFINSESGRPIPLEQAIRGINNNNPNYENYHVSHSANGTPYVRSNPNRKTNDNIE